ncbi:hypothetical protein [Pseudoxanthomonas sp. PXM02]|uniref:hypothetical protein n=1 Tax=Pseudoxanthomonas sp. PXM02 TaxID=2769294 RepID=UPI0017866580|nr:hypothetical protein [Pseudoxanthomonas sp. PXM02]MBD9479454.1 hypothetical protein [Pseudoxanthomonas sp. PXM02]
MPDSLTRDPMPRDWDEAFGALPLDVPPAGSWQRLSTALPVAPAPRRRWGRSALALAATLALAAVVPLMSPRLQQRQAPLPSEGDRAVASVRAHSEVPANAAPPVAAEDMVKTPTPSPPIVLTAASASRSVGRARDARLDALYGESARLEAVLAQLPDSGVTDAASIAVATGLQDQVAHIDVALSQPALPIDARTALWQERVDTLRQLTGVEATQHWNVAFGDIASASDTTIY